MRICPKCGTPNRDGNYYCRDCDTVLTGAKRVSGDEIIAHQMKLADRREKNRKWLLLGIFSFVSLLVDGFMIYLAMGQTHVDGTAFDLWKIFRLFPWYIPILFVALFDFDWLYGKILTACHKPIRHFPDAINTAIVAFAIAAWFYLECLICGVVIFSW